MKPTKIILLLLLSSTLLQGDIFAQTIGGIGAQLFLDTANGFTMPRIARLVPNTPADTILHATDYIMKVNDVSCKDKTIEDVVALIRGEVGTTVKITVADTKEGKRQREYTLPRVSIQAGPAPDPLTTFYADCESEVKQMRRTGAVIIKTFNSDCGNYFFNFNAETAGTYHVRLMTMQEKPKEDSVGNFYPTARIFDGDHEAAAITIDKVMRKNEGSMLVAQVEGDLSFTKSGVGVVNVQIHDDVQKCKGMYIVVYKPQH